MLIGKGPEAAHINTAAPGIRAAPGIPSGAR
jgi:hypothetical protein